MSATESALKIQNGSFQTNGKPLVLKDGDKYNKPVISGSTFDIAPDKEYYAENSELIKDENGQFIVCNHSHTELKNIKEATCTEKGYTRDTYCKDCGTLLESGSAIEATGEHTDVNNDGKCDTCGHDMKADAPSQTSDNHSAFWFALAPLAATGFTACSFIGKKRKYSK